MAKTDQERREAPRVDMACPVFLEGDSVANTLVNISLGGVLIDCDSETKKRYHVGKLIKLSIKSPVENERIEAHVRVLGFSSLGMHCGFEYLDKKTQAAIDRCIDMS